MGKYYCAGTNAVIRPREFLYFCAYELVTPFREMAKKCFPLTRKRGTRGVRMRHVGVALCIHERVHKRVHIYMRTPLHIYLFIYLFVFPTFPLARLSSLVSPLKNSRKRVAQNARGERLLNLTGCARCWLFLHCFIYFFFFSFLIKFVKQQS